MTVPGEWRGAAVDLPPGHPLTFRLAGGAFVLDHAGPLGVPCP